MRFLQFCLMAFILTGCIAAAPKQLQSVGAGSVSANEASLVGDWTADPSICGQVQCTPMGVRFTKDQMGMYKIEGNTKTFVSGGMRPYRAVGNGSLFVENEGYIDYSLSSNGRALRICQYQNVCTNLHR